MPPIDAREADAVTQRGGEPFRQQLGGADGHGRPA
jgi:hypothetical protein